MKKYLPCLLISVLAAGLLLAGCGRAAQEPAEETPDVATATPATTAPVAVDEAAPAPEIEMEEAVVEEEPAAPAEPAKLIARVDGKEITDADIQKVMDAFMKQMGGRLPPAELEANMARIRERILEELIMRQVMLDAVAKEGISLSDSEFAEIKSELAEELPPGMTLEAYMQESGTTEDQMREQMTVRKMIIAKAESVEKPNDEEVKAFYDENQEGFSQGATVTASHILIKVDPSDDEAAKAAKLQRIQDLRQQILSGADFAELARENSDCPSASNGGDLGSFGKGDMVPAFEDAAFSQPVGSVGEVVETPFGYHLIKVTEKADAKTLAFNEVADRIRDILYSQKQQDAVREYVDGLRAAANVERFDEPAPEETVLDLEVEEDMEPAVENEASAVEAPEAVVETLTEEVVEPAAEAPVEMETEAVAVPEEAAVVETTAEEVVEPAAEAPVEVEAEAVAVPEEEAPAEAVAVEETPAETKDAGQP